MGEEWPRGRAKEGYRRRAPKTAPSRCSSPASPCVSPLCADHGWLERALDTAHERVVYVVDLRRQRAVIGVLVSGGSGKTMYGHCCSPDLSQHVYLERERLEHGAELTHDRLR